MAKDKIVSKVAEVQVNCNIKITSDMISAIEVEERKREHQKGVVYGSFSSQPTFGALAT